MKNGFKNPKSAFCKRLEHLMSSAGINPAEKGASLKLCQDMYKMGVLEYFNNEEQAKERDNARRRIDDHRKKTAAIEIGSEWIKRYCDYFHCSADYLFGFIDEPTHQITDITKTTGLSEEAINHLHELKKTFPKYIDSLNFLLTSDNFDNVLYRISTYAKSVKLCYGLLGILNTQKQAYFSKQQADNPGICNYPHALQERYTNSEKDMDIEEYKLDTNFRYIIQELRNKNKS